MHWIAGQRVLTCFDQQLLFLCHLTLTKGWFCVHLGQLYCYYAIWHANAFGMMQTDLMFQLKSGERCGSLWKHWLSGDLVGFLQQYAWIRYLYKWHDTRIKHIYIVYIYIEIFLVHQSMWTVRSICRISDRSSFFWCVWWAIAAAEKDWQLGLWARWFLGFGAVCLQLPHVYMIFQTSPRWKGICLKIRIMSMYHSCRASVELQIQTISHQPLLKWTPLSLTQYFKATLIL